MRINANEVGVFKAKYMGFQKTKNSDFVMAKLQFTDFEINGDINSNFPMAQTNYLLHDADKMSVFEGLTEGQAYLFKMSVRFQKENNKEDKIYPAGIKFNVLEVIKQ